MPPYSPAHVPPDGEAWGFEDPVVVNDGTLVEARRPGIDVSAGPELDGQRSPAEEYMAHAIGVK